MTCQRLCSLLVFSSALAIALPSGGQQTPAAPPAPAMPQAGGPGGGGPGGPPRGPQPPPTNLKVLPKTMSHDEVVKLMRTFTGDLGVQCEFCHAQNATTHRVDAASDANPVKDQARYMITMTADLNNQYLENLPGKRYGDPITCGTCHRGESHPSVFVPKPQQGPGGPPPGAGGGAPGGAAGQPR